MANEEDDPVVQEIDVYLAKSLAEKLYLFQMGKLKEHRRGRSVQQLKLGLWGQTGLRSNSITP
ncbi:POLR3E isoform 19 [Pan troglodytes]|uniref:RNA polymerase III subunit E n=6 Tax=Hominidae TaxID=9604 RepID=H3BSM3_HUMAN|nr:RNA polymerase III subunit E [Homo sapiens]KAI4054008.1 RNA polymerase III subunit E [Homo sapiens]PNI13024.1 POLR3E isoform 19 [Pan troglodytes]PNJ05476.1 POLR3E isoform 8 [Pongo abelii]